ncbi:hypothetical protein JCM10207_002797 [Rhodosporidiobolus poonsookiae]
MATTNPAPTWTPLPTPYYLFFTLLEPVLTLIGAWLAISSPSSYFLSLYPPNVLPPAFSAVKEADLHPAAPMQTRQLGSCFFLFALMGLVVLPRVERVLRSRPAEMEKIVKAYLGCLAAADLTHIGFTLLDLPPSARFAVSHWNQLVWGNVAITAGLFVVRGMWFAGVGRASGGKERRE